MSLRRPRALALVFPLLASAACAGATPSTDAGTDASPTVDASPGVDSGPPRDSGTDTGLLDAEAGHLDADTGLPDAGPADAGPGPTGCSPACTSAETCVKKQVNGGARLPVDDAGACPPGRHPSGGYCVNDPTFACATTPAACGGAVGCACASALCGSFRCTGASVGQLDCVLDAP